MPAIRRGSRSCLVKIPPCLPDRAPTLTLVGSDRRPLLLDTGAGVAVYADLLANGLAELSHSRELDQIVATHGHPDHIGGVRQVREKFGELEVLKKPWPERDAAAGAAPITAIESDARIFAEGASCGRYSLPAMRPTICAIIFLEERALFTGDLMLGAGTTVIPEDGGDLAQYLDSLRLLLEIDLETIYPAHRPVIRNPRHKIREYIAHRELRATRC